MSKKLTRLRPSPAMIVALVALVAALGGTAYAAGQINGNSIKAQSIGGGKLKKQTLTGYQVNVDKLGEVPYATRATHTFWAVVQNPAGTGNAALTRSSNSGAISAVEGGGSVSVIFPMSVAGCAPVAGRDTVNDTGRQPGTVQTNISATNPNAVEVHTRNEKGEVEDADFNLIVVCS